MALISADGEVGRVPTTAREVYDVVGAGDTVTAYLATMLAAGGDGRRGGGDRELRGGRGGREARRRDRQPDEVLEAYDLFGAAGAPTA